MAMMSVTSKSSVIYMTLPRQLKARGRESVLFAWCMLKVSVPVQVKKTAPWEQEPGAAKRVLRDVSNLRLY